MLRLLRLCALGKGMIITKKWQMQCLSTARGEEVRLCVVVPKSPVLGAATEDVGGWISALLVPRRDAACLLSTPTTSLRPSTGRGSFSFPARKLPAAAGRNTQVVGVGKGGVSSLFPGEGRENEAIQSLGLSRKMRNLFPCAASSKRGGRNPASGQDYGNLLPFFFPPRV